MDDALGRTFFAFIELLFGVGGADAQEVAQRQTQTADKSDVEKFAPAATGTDVIRAVAPRAGRGLFHVRTPCIVRYATRKSCSPLRGKSQSLVEKPSPTPLAVSQTGYSSIINPCRFLLVAPSLS